MRNGKISIFISYENFAKIKNFRKNEVENTSNFAKILKQNERILFVNFREFRSTKISMETLSKTSEALGCIEIFISKATHESISRLLKDKDFYPS